MRRIPVRRPAGNAPSANGPAATGWSTGAPRRQPAVIAALVAVVVLVGGVILWRFFGDALSSRSDTAADRCLGGQATVAVAADPAIADSVAAFAKTFNETAGPVGDKCVAVSVTAADSSAVVDGLLGSWPGNLGDKPAVWIQVARCRWPGCRPRPAPASSARRIRWPPPRCCWRCDLT